MTRQRWLLVGFLLFAVGVAAVVYYRQVVVPTGSWSGRLAAAEALKVSQRQPRLPFRRLQGHADGVHQTAVSADGMRIATASQDGTARLWDAATGQCLLTLAGHAGAVMTCAISPDGKLIATGGMDSNVIVWDATSGEIVAMLPGHIERASRVAFLPDGTLLTTDGAGYLRRWDVRSERELSKGFLFGPEGESRLVLSIAVRRDGSRIYLAAHGGTLTCWDPRTNQAIWQQTVQPAETLPGRPIPAPFAEVHLSPDETKLYTLNYAERVSERDAITGERLRDFSGPIEPRQIAIHLDGKRMAISDAEGVFLWEIPSTGTALVRGQGMETQQYLHDLTFDPKGRFLVAGQGGRNDPHFRDNWWPADNGDVQIWDLVAATASATH